MRRNSYGIIMIGMICSMLGLQACSPSVDEGQVTLEAEVPLESAHVSEETLDPSETPTDIPPTPESSPTPFPAFQDDYSIFGNIQLSFVPYNDQAELPEPPMDLTLVIELEGGGNEERILITDSGGGFGIALDPGNYVISSLEVDSPSISDNTASLLTGYPSFTVVEDDCVYIGRISISYYRFPPGDYFQQNEWISEFSAQIGREVYAIIFGSGSLVPESGNIDLPDQSLWPDGAEDCQILGAQW